MLSCGKVVGQLTKVARHVQGQEICRPFKYDGFLSVTNFRFKSGNNTDKPPPRRVTGATLRAEECSPMYSKGQKGTQKPICDPTSCHDICGVPYEAECGGGNSQDPKGPKNSFDYWKKILAVFIVAGATIYMVIQNGMFQSDDSDAEKKGKDKGNLVKGSKKIKTPVSSKEIPHHVPYLLIGGGTAAFSAFRSIKSNDPKAKVLVITEESDLPYMRPPLSKEMWYNTDKDTTDQFKFTQWNGSQRRIFYEPPEFYTKVQDVTELEKGGVSVATGWKVQKIDVTRKIAILEDGHEIQYDKCLIATGATPKNLSIFESAEEAVKEKVTTFRTTEDFLRLHKDVGDNSIKNIVIVGGGFLGSELACSLARNLDSEKKKIHQIYKEKYIMAQVLPEYLSEWTTKQAVMEGVNCIASSEIVDYAFKQGKLSLNLSSGQTIEADRVVVAVGVEANTEIAKESELEVHPEIGGFLVNAELEARSNVWIAGDAACFYDVKLGRRRVEHYDHAVISGRLAGDNMTGAGRPYLHQSMFWSDLGPEVGYEAVGIIDATLPTVGVFSKSSDKEEDSKTTTNYSKDKNNQSANEKLDISKSNGESKSVDGKDPTTKSTHRDFRKGVVFYMRDDVVVGILLWNIFNRMSIARQVLARETHYDELNEVAKLFTIHEE